MKNPLVGRRIQITQNDRLVYVGIVIDSFWAPDFYRIVIEVELRCDGDPVKHDGSRAILTIPVGGFNGFRAFVDAPPGAQKVCKFCNQPMLDKICEFNRAPNGDYKPCEP